jgi:hypothetical protein
VVKLSVVVENNEQIQQVVVEVIKRLAARLGADGSRGTLMVVLTGATVALSEAIQQIRYLSLDGYRLQLVFSKAAEDLYGGIVRDQVAGFPHISIMDSSQWIIELEKARAVVVPLLSMNTVSKVSMLIADTVATNLILHGLFMGKSVFAARNGADPYGEHWQEKIGNGTQNRSVRKALLKRLEVIGDYGCLLIDVRELRSVVNGSLVHEKYSVANRSDNTIQSARLTITHSKKMVTAADIRHAHHLGADLRLAPASLITPLALDLAMKYDVTLLET